MKNLINKIKPIKNVRIVEVGLRDGLQNEKEIVPINVKIELLKKLSNSGLQSIEVGSFVSPKWVPQMENTDKLCNYIKEQKQLNSEKLQTKNISFSVLTPNMKGLLNAIKYDGMDEIAIFGAASEEFSQKNINCSIEESLDKFEPVVKHALIHKKKVRGYISCVLGCPFSGSISPSKVADITKEMLKMGCYEISLGDTIGIGTVGTTENLLHHLIEVENIPPEKLAVHFHDTYGQALANIYVALQYGIRVIDSSISGLGGCPYAGESASGNVATEDVLYMLHGSDIETGVNMDKILEASLYIDSILNRKSSSKYVCSRVSKQIMS
jgi:hydroxymethylglutaryl-CoA lyase